MRHVLCISADWLSVLASLHAFCEQSFKGAVVDGGTEQHTGVPLGHFYSPQSVSGAPQRSPMQWSADANVGFNDRTNVTWLPVHPDYRSVNVEVQKGDEGSVLSQYRRLSGLRQREPALQRGWFCHVGADRGVFAYLRELDGLERAFLLVLNSGGRAAVTDLSAVAELPERLRVAMSTERADGGEAVISKSRIATEAGEGLMLEFSSNARFHANHPGLCYISEKACYLGALDILYTC